MAEISNIDDCRPHVVVNNEDRAIVIGIDKIKRIALGETSIAEFDDPELISQALALLAMEFIGDD